MVDAVVHFGLFVVPPQIAPHLAHLQTVVWVGYHSPNDALHRRLQLFVQPIARLPCGDYLLEYLTHHPHVDLLRCLRPRVEYLAPRKVLVWNVLYL